MATDVTTVEDMVRDDFALTNDLDGSQLWQVVQQGTGQNIDLSTPSVLKVTTGTTANQETIIRSRKTWQNPVRVMFLCYQAMLLSQRIANQEIELRLCSVDGAEIASWLFDGTVATTAKQRSRNGGTVLPADTSVTVVDTGNGSSTFELEVFPDEVYWHNRQADNAGVRNNSYVRNRQVPNPQIPLCIEIRVRNLATAPASSTTLQLDAVLVQDINEITAEITAGRGGGAMSQSVPVVVQGNPAVNPNGGKVTTANVQAASDPLTSTNLGAGATFTQAAWVDSQADVTLRPTRQRVAVQHTAGQAPGTLILQESHDNGTTVREVWRCPVPSDGNYHTFEMPVHLRYYRWLFVNGATAQTNFWLSTLLVRGEGIADLEKNLLFPLTVGAGQAAAISAVTTFPVLDLGGNHSWDSVRVMVMSDQIGTFAIQQSQDSANWITTTTGNLTLAASSPQVVDEKIWGRYIRLVHTNNATTAATNVRVAAALVTK